MSAYEHPKSIHSYEVVLIEITSIVASVLGSYLRPHAIHLAPSPNMASLADMKATDKSDTNPVPIDGETEVYIDPVMEKRIIRKFDMLALPQYILVIILAYLDRTNIGMLPVLSSMCFH